MSHDIMRNVNDEVMAVFARGTGATKNVWHASFTGAQVLDIDSLSVDDIPVRLLPKIRLVTPLDPETGEECSGLSIIKADGFARRFGQAGGLKRTSWTPAQPAKVLEALLPLREAGAEIAGVFWLEPGRLYIEGMLPDDSVWGDDPHEVRFSAILDYSGLGCDRLAVYLTRIVCANTSRIALYEANKKGSVLKIRHSANVEDQWSIDAPEFLSDYSARVKEHQTKLQTLNSHKLRPQDWSSFFTDYLGGPLEKDASKRAQTQRAYQMEALEKAWKEERENAEKTNIDPDSARVGYEAITNVLNHGAKVTTPKGVEWKPVLNAARNDTARMFNVAIGSHTDKAMQCALAEVGLDRASMALRVPEPAEPAVETVGLVDDIFSAIG